MDLETCKKYILFVSRQCDRYLEDGRVMDDELFQLIIEFVRFKEKVAESELPDALKEKISSVDFRYTRSGVNRSKGTLILAVITLGIWAVIIWLGAAIPVVDGTRVVGIITSLDVLGAFPAPAPNPTAS